MRISNSSFCFSSVRNWNNEHLHQHLDFQGIQKEELLIFTASNKSFHYLKFRLEGAPTLRHKHPNLSKKPVLRIGSLYIGKTGLLITFLSMLKNREAATRAAKAIDGMLPW